MSSLHVNRTSRICFRHTTIYTTSQVVTSLKQVGLLLQLGQKHFPSQGETPQVIKELCYHAIRSPDSFTSAGRRWLEENRPTKIIKQRVY